MKSTTQPAKEAYDELCAYALALRDRAFIHQHVVDAFAAQDAGEQDKPIRVTFALIGLYLHLEKGYSGREVQRAHMALARRKRAWPKFVLPHNRGAMTAVEVLATAPGPDRARAIDDWCESVWQAYAASRETVATLLAESGIAPKSEGPRHPTEPASPSRGGLS